MKKIKRISLFFRVIFQALFVLLPIVYAYVWIVAPQPVSFLSQMFVIHAIPANLPAAPSLGLETRGYGFLVTMIPVGMAMLGLYILVKLFRLYEHGFIFELKNVHCLRSLGYVLLLSQFLQIVYDVLISLVWTWHNPSGHGVIAIAVGSSNIAILLASFLLILVSWIMAEACKLKEEHKFTI